MRNPISSFLEQVRQATQRSVTIEENRRYHRASFPWLRVELRGFSPLARDWSAGGVAIDAGKLDIPVGAIVQGRVGWAASDIRYPFYADLVRRMPDGRLALRWLELDAAFLRELDNAAHAGEPLER